MKDVFILGSVDLVYLMIAFVGTSRLVMIVNIF